MNYNILKKAELIELLKEKDEEIKKLRTGKGIAEYFLELREEKQEKRINDLKKEIKRLIAKEEKRLSISYICNKLDINRKTFYNNKLDKFLKDLYLHSFIATSYDATVLKLSKITRGKDKGKYKLIEHTKNMFSKWETKLFDSYELAKNEVNERIKSMESTIVEFEEKDKITVY